VISVVSDQDLEAAARALRVGELVVLPTETVYGLGADASLEAAVHRIYSVKGRPADHPLIVHVASLANCYPWVDDGIALDRLHKLGLAFWPGPLTVIVPLKDGAPNFASAGQNTIGLRIPSHAMALDLIRRFHALGGLGVAAPSANRFGKVSPTSAAHVRADLGNDVTWILDGGDCEVGLESTIIDLTCHPARILRPGAISALELSQCLDEFVAQGATAASPQVSGSLASHYAPDTALKLLSTSELLAESISHLEQSGVWASQETINKLAANVKKTQVAKDNPQAFGHELYAVLRAIDSWGVEQVLIEVPPAASTTGPWAAVLDRLTRASHS
jgi:L-threonylcarbamoyladenylate synthase